MKSHGKEGYVEAEQKPKWYSCLSRDTLDYKSLGEVWVSSLQPFEIAQPFTPNTSFQNFERTHS